MNYSGVGLGQRSQFLVMTVAPGDENEISLHHDKQL